MIYPLAGNFFGNPVSLDFSPYGDLIGLGMDNGLIVIFWHPGSHPGLTLGPLNLSERNTDV